MRAGAALSSIRWGPILLGVTFGLLVMALISFGGFLVVNQLGGSDLALLSIVTIANFAAQLLAGFVAGKFASQAAVFNGSLAGLGFFTVSTALQILDGSQAGLFTFFLFGIISAMLGAAGGAWAARKS